MIKQIYKGFGRGSMMDNQVIDLCWKLFASTGKVSYYMLYHQLQSIDITKEAEKEEERDL